MVDIVKQNMAMNLGFHNGWGVSWPAEQLSVSQENAYIMSWLAKQKSLEN
jgi:hypothetical protein